ncbi:hypothetical protein Tco_1327277 [Tanacetum coccineum]
MDMMSKFPTNNEIIDDYCCGLHDHHDNDRSQWMDDLNITMEEYIRLEEENARKCGKVFNWETAKYGRIWYDEDVLDL